jgi:peptidoglycan/LPS O-acetylase OafA/YrhL
MSDVAAAKPDVAAPAAGRAPGHMQYRPEVDGLRALAVLPVIFFHAQFPGFEGGYVGVDVFFVISGYLITTIILGERAANAFAIVKFYERRARRILPALFFMMAMMLPFAWFMMLPPQLKYVAQSMIAVAFFVPNIYFWRSGGYFDGVSDEKPLLHTWSLGVEEQYYMFFPLFVLMLWGLGRRKLMAATAVVGLVSLVASEYFLRSPVANFYLIPTRAWEMLVGSMLAFASFEKPTQLRVSKAAGNVLSLVGLALVAYGITFYNHDTPFPGLHALPPTIGTALVIACSGPDTITTRLLSLNPVVKIGLISYSAYLYHQPMFALARVWVGGHPHWGVMAALSVASLLLAYLSWRYVEKPFREKGVFTRAQIFKMSGVGSLVVIALGLAGHFTDGFAARFDEQQRTLFDYADATKHGGYVHKLAIEWDKPFSTASDKPKLLIIGDSFSQDFVNVVNECGALAKYEIRTAYIARRCQMYLGPEDVTDLRGAANEAFCKHEPSVETALPKVKQADVIIMVSRWADWSATRLPTTLDNLGLRPDQKVFVVSGKQFGTVRLRELAKLDDAGRKAFVNPASPEKDDGSDILRAMAPQLAARVPAVTFIDQQTLLCGAKTTCRLFNDGGELLSHDGGHLTQPGARWAGRVLFTQSALATLN